MSRAEHGPRLGLRAREVCVPAACAPMPTCLAVAHHAIRPWRSRLGRVRFLIIKAMGACACHGGLSTDDPPVAWPGPSRPSNPSQSDQQPHSPRFPPHKYQRLRAHPARVSPIYPLMMHPAYAKTCNVRAVSMFKLPTANCQLPSCPTAAAKLACWTCR